MSAWLENEHKLTNSGRNSLAFEILPEPLGELSPRRFHHQKGLWTQGRPGIRIAHHTRLQPPPQRRLRKPVPRHQAPHFPASPATQWAIQHSRPTARLRHSSDLRLSGASLSHYIYELSLAVNAELFVYAFHMRPNRVMGYEQPLARLRHCVPARQQVNNFYFPQRQSVRFFHPFKTRTFLFRRLRQFRQCGRLSHCGKEDGAPDKGNRHSKCERNSNQAAGTKVNLREQSIKGGFRKRSRV